MQWEGVCERHVWEDRQDWISVHPAPVCLEWHNKETGKKKPGIPVTPIKWLWMMDVFNYLEKSRHADMTQFFK